MSDRVRRIIWIALIVILVGAIPSYIIFKRVYTRREIAAEREKLRDEGRMMTIADLRGPEIPDAENGAFYYGQAINELKEYPLTQKAKSLLYKICRLQAPLNEGNTKILRPIVSRYKDVYSLVAKGNACAKSRFNIEYEKGLDAPLDFLPPINNICRLLLVKARLEANKPEGAVKGITAALRLCESQRDPLIIVSLVAWSMESMCLENLQALISDGVFSVNQLEQIDRRLKALREADTLSQGFSGERIIFSHTIKLLREGKLDYSEVYKLWGGNSKLELVANKFDPLNLDLDAQELELVRLCGEAEKLAALPFYKTVNERGKLEKYFKENARESLFYIMEGDALTHLTVRAGRMARIDTARVALSAEIHRLKTGAWPEKAPVETIDPFTGNPLHYEIKNQTLRVWSVGENLTNDNGVEDHNKKKDDICFELPVSIFRQTKDETE